jgi:low temperature requirement protein LtrA
VLYLLVSRGYPGLRRSVSGYAVSTTLAVVALVVGAFLDGDARVAMWCLAVAIDLVGPAIFGIEGWRIVPEHFAERHNLVVIIALGESVVALGVATEVALNSGVVVAAVLGVALASALWWVYFDVVALVTRERLARAPAGRVRNALARDSYSFLHLPMVAGIVLAAFGLEEAVLHLDEHLHTVPATALLGGVALYLAGHVALRLRNARTINPQRLGLAVLLVALIPISTQVPALVTLIGVTAPLWLMIAYETARYGDVRYRLRHGLDIEPPLSGMEAERS